MTSITASTAPTSLWHRLTRLGDREQVLAWLMLSPAVLFIVVLVGTPFLLALFYSLSNVTVGSTEMAFVGLSNFEAITANPTFWRSLGNTFLFTFVSQALVVVLAKVLAMALMKDFRGKWLVRLLVILPWVAPISLGSIGWLWIFDSIYSVLNWGLHQMGWLDPEARLFWLGREDLAMGSIITVHVWRMLPLATIILLAGLSAIPADLHDAAAIDGARFWRHLFQINLPLVMPIMLVAVLFGMVFTFTDMIVIFILTRGGPYDSTQMLASLAYFTGIDGGDLAEGAAISLFLFPLLVVVAVVMLSVAKRSEVT